MDNKIKKIFISIVCTIIIIIVLIVMLLVVNKNREEIMPDEAYPSFEINEDITLVDNYNTYYSVLEAISKYCSYATAKSNEALLNILDDEYINENGIDYDNVLEKIGSTYTEDINYENKEIYIKDDYIYPVYITYGILKYGETNEKLYLIIYVDQSTTAYSVYPIDEDEYNKIIKYNGENIEVKEVERNDYNKFSFINVSESTIATNLFMDYIRKVEEDVSLAYNTLEEEYKLKRFGDISEYNKYVNDISDELDNISITSYQITEYNDYTRYIFIDNYDNYYVFNVTAVMQYTVMMDTYTLDLPEFLEQYNSTNNQGKTALNIQKFIQALNAKDYSYAYSKLADSFKNNYFKTEEDFEKYAKSTFFSINKAEYGAFSVEGDVNTYEITLTDQTGEKTNQIKFNVVMQLKEGTDFVMSFGS